MFGKKKQILLLEDEVALSKALCIKLQNEGYGVATADNGEEAISLLDKKHFDLAILDLVTPKIDGFGVLKHLKSISEDMPVFIVSNLSQREDMKEALSMGANKFFIKSNISLNEILEEAKQFLG